MSAIRRCHCIVKCNWFRINCGRSAAFIYFYPSLIYSRVTYEITSRKKFSPRNKHEKKSWIHEIPKKRNSEPRKNPREKSLDPRNTFEIKFRIREIPMRKHFGSPKARRHDDTRPTRPAMARDARKLAHSGHRNIWEC